MEVKGRFAPSPTGRMHLGNVLSALLSWLSAKSKGGKWILRIEDLDPQRSRHEYSRLIEEDLLRLGLEWDEGGVDADGGMYCQSRRTDIYRQEFAKLEAAGMVYPCWCSRADILAAQAPHESDGRIVYPGTCRHLKEAPSSSKSPAMRIIVPDMEMTFTDLVCGPQSVNLAEHCGDFIVRRSDGVYAYQLAVVVDDALMGVTEVVRGHDLLLSTSEQLYLYQELNLDAPLFAHTPLLCASDGRRLCKRDASLDMGELLKRRTPEEIVGCLAFLAGIIDRNEPCRPSDLLGSFHVSMLDEHSICLPQACL